MEWNAMERPADHINAKMAMRLAQVAVALFRLPSMASVCHRSKQTQRISCIKVWVMPIDAVLEIYGRNAGV